MRFIYILKDPRTDEIRYVGQTKNPKRRLNDHVNTSQNIRSSNYQTYKSTWIRKLLKNDIYPVMEIIETCQSLEESNVREKYWIDKLSHDGLKLTNSQTDDVTEFSKKTKERMSSARKGKKLVEIVGEVKAEEMTIKFVERIKEYWTGRKKEENQKEKISNTLKDFFSNPENHWAYGKKMSDEHNEKLRLSKINNPKNIGNTKPRTEEQKKKIREKIKGSKIKRSQILQFDLNGNLLREWKSMREIERETDFFRPQISKCCKGLKVTYGGFIWKYKD